VTTTLAPAASGLSALIIGAIESKIATGKAMYGVENMGNGCLAGLAAITASCNVVRPWAAIIIGAVAGALYLAASKVSVKIKLDDPLDAVAVHAWNGLWGILAAGLFSDVTLVGNSYLTNDPAGVPFPRGGGLFYSGGPGRGRQLAAQVVYAIWVAGWVLANMVRLFLLSFWFLERKREREERSNPSTKNSAHSPPLEKKNVKKKHQVPFWLILKVTGLLRVPSDEEIVGLDHSYHGGSAYPGGPEEAEDKSLKGPVPTSRDLAAIKSELAELKAAVAKSSA
jgi:Amt family ammonium transporter